MNALVTKCLRCGSDAEPLEVEFFGDGSPSEVVRLNAWVRCPVCGPRLNVRPEAEQKATVDFICPVSAE